MEKTKEFDVTVGSGIISIFQRQNFKLDRVFSEFVDNSLQSYLDHEKQLRKLPDCDKCYVEIVWDRDSITIKDNAYGMNEEEFGRALKLKAKNPNASRDNQLSVYGMGLKYAAAYLGDKYRINTTAFGSNINYNALIDIREFENNNPETINAKLSSAEKEDHVTVIEITDVRHKLTPKKEEDLRIKLGVIYNHYIREGKLDLVFNKKPVSYIQPEFWKKDDGTKYYEEIKDHFIVEGKKYYYTGWVAVLARGDQSITGLNLVQANRCIALNYRPEALWGKGNSFENSRVLGEIVFSGPNYVLTFNKDEFVWSGGAEDAFIQSLSNNEAFSSIVKAANNLKKTSSLEKIQRKVFGVSAKELKKENNVSAEKTTAKFKKAKPINTAVAKKDTEKVKPKEKETKTEEKAIMSDDFPKYEVTVRNKIVDLYVDIYDGKPDTNWLVFEKYKGGYILHINNKNSYIVENYGDGQASQSAIDKMAISLAKAAIKSQEKGLRLTDTLILIKSLNELIKLK